MRDPEGEGERLCAFLDLDVPGGLFAHVERRATHPPEPVAVAPAVRALVDRTWDRLRERAAADRAPGTARRAR